MAADQQTKTRFIQLADASQECSTIVYLDAKTKEIAAFDKQLKFFVFAENVDAKVQTQCEQALQSLTLEGVFVLTSGVFCGKYLRQAFGIEKPKGIVLFEPITRKSIVHDTVSREDIERFVEDVCGTKVKLGRVDMQKGTVTLIVGQSGAL